MAFLGVFAFVGGNWRCMEAITAAETRAVLRIEAIAGVGSASLHCREAITAAGSPSSRCMEAITAAVITYARLD